MAIGALDNKCKANTSFTLPVVAESFSNQNITATSKTVSDGPLLNSVTTKHTIRGGQTINANYIIGWHFANLKLNPVIEGKGRFYNQQFKNASSVVEYVATHFESLSTQTKLWRQTWYDSTLPWWFLERTFLNISTLSTTTAHRFDSGRFYAWEGVGCCEGTCMHVWQYAQAMGRIFPAIERDTRERVDLGLSLTSNGMIYYRGEVVKTAAIDGQAGNHFKNISRA